MIVQVIGPAILFLPGTQPFRVVLRTSVFGIGLLGLIIPRRSRENVSHPSARILVAAVLYVATMIFHPLTNTCLSGIAQTMMHLGVVAPLLWAPRYFSGDTHRLARVLTILWIFNGASVIVGILQVRDPVTWMPSEFSSVVLSTQHGVAGLRYRGDDGRVIIRPPGLGDAPGAACGSGLLVASIGLAYLGLPVSHLRRVLGICGMMLGVTVIFLTQVRSSLLMLIGSAVVFMILLVMQRRFVTLTLLASTTALCGMGALQYASSLGGRSTIDRFTTLVEDDPLTVYDRSSRLGMVTGAFDTLAHYPLGAGLGRYGMMRVYFGDESNLESPECWAEVQFPAWVLDGGAVLLCLYLAAIAVAVRRMIRITLSHRSRATRDWAGAIVMLSASPIAFMFSYSPFNSQMGMQFWFLIGALEGVATGGDAPGPAATARRPRRHEKGPGSAGLPPAGPRVPSA